MASPGQCDRQGHLEQHTAEHCEQEENVQYRNLNTASLAELTGPQSTKAFIPDADTCGAKFVLDLASGEMLAGGQEPGESPEQRVLQFTRLGKGDLALDRVLICLRGATARVREGDEWVPLPMALAVADCTSYELPGALPWKLLITTGDGTRFEVTVLSASDKGINVEWKRADASTP